MTPDICILFTMTDGSALYRCAVKIDNNKLPNGFETVQYWAEEENAEALRKLLPSHVASIGNVVGVEEIFELKDLTK